MRGHTRRIGRRALAAARRQPRSLRDSFGPVRDKGGGRTTIFMKLMPRVLRRLSLYDEFADSDVEGGGLKASARYENRASGARGGWHRCGITSISLPHSTWQTWAEENLKLAAGLQYIGKALHAARSSLVLFVDPYHTMYAAYVKSCCTPQKLWQSVMYLLPNTTYQQPKADSPFSLAAAPWRTGAAR